MKTFCLSIALFFFASVPAFAVINVQSIYNACSRTGDEDQTLLPGFLCFKSAAFDLQAPFSETCASAGKANVPAGYRCYKSAFQSAGSVSVNPRNKLVSNACTAAGSEGIHAGYYCFKTFAIELKAPFGDECLKIGKDSIHDGYFCYKKGFLASPF